jgi:hypothetical protein
MKTSWIPHLSNGYTDDLFWVKKDILWHNSMIGPWTRPIHSLGNLFVFFASWDLHVAITTIRFQASKTRWYTLFHVCTIPPRSVISLKILENTINFGHSNLTHLIVSVLLAEYDSNLFLEAGAFHEFGVCNTCQRPKQSARGSEGIVPTAWEAPSDKSERTRAQEIVSMEYRRCIIQGARSTFVCDWRDFAVHWKAALERVFQE